MRLYRGIKTPYRPEKVGRQPLAGTDFTDCPAIALRYAAGSRGELLVVDIPETAACAPRVTEELWLGMEAKRFMIWGVFDCFLAAVLPAKDLRTCLRREGLRSAPDSRKASVLREVISAQIQRGQGRGAPPRAVS